MYTNRYARHALFARGIVKYFNVVVEDFGVELLVRCIIACSGLDCLRNESENRVRMG
jgi:hypothetical protein